MDRDHLILYKNDNVPLKHILEYLKSIELEMVEKYATRNYKDLSSHLNHIITGNADNGVIAIHEIAKKCNIPVESALGSSDQEKEKSKGQGR